MRALSKFLLLFIAGCGVPWAVVMQSGPPSAISGAGQVTYAADFNSLIMDGQPIGNLLGSESPDEQANIQTAFQTMNQEFLDQFAARINAPVIPAAGPPQPGEVRLTGRYVNIERGARGPFGRATRVTMRFSFSVGGQVTDEVEMSRAMKPSLTRASVARRMNACAKQLGVFAAKYFNREQNRQ